MIFEVINPFKYLYEKLNLKYTDDDRYWALINRYTNKNKKIKGGGKGRIIFMCDGALHHGGLADRERGILTVFLIAYKLKRPFSIYWTQPFDLSDFLEPNHYDWKITENEILIDKNISDVIVFNKFPTQYYKRNLLSYFLLIIEIIKNKKDKHVYTNLNFPKNKFHSLYHKLFKPSPLLEKKLRDYNQILGDKYWSISFRFMKLLGDFKDGYGKILNEYQRESLINKNLQEIKKFLINLPENYRCFITSDSITFLRRVTALDPRIFIIEGNISHIDYLNSSSPDWMKLFSDQYLIMNAEHIILFRTEEMYKSNFSEFAALIGGKKFTIHEF